MPCWEAGPRRAPTVVFLHGATADHRSWDPQVEALRDRFRTVTVDLRGHGDSPELGLFDFHAAVDDVLDLLDGRDRPLALVGLSLGGAIAQEVVYRAPQSVDALVVADATCVTAPRGLLDKPIAYTALTGMALLPQEIFHRQAARALANDAEVSEDLQEWSPSAAVQVLTELVSALHPDRDYRLPVPTLLLHGSDDRLGDIARSTRDWAGRDPAAEYAVVPDAGHVSNLDNPEAFTAELRSFLERTLPAVPDGARTGGGHVAPARGGRRWMRRVSTVLRRHGSDPEPAVTCDPAARSGGGRRARCPVSAGRGPSGTATDAEEPR
ncbi:MAG: alpha/beta hydrolase [Actinomycetota bacterium]|nr:alpha/beta hydrolase [Actinomycetota bacterium]